MVKISSQTFEWDKPEFHQRIIKENPQAIKNELRSPTSAKSREVFIQAMTDKTWMRANPEYSFRAIQMMPEPEERAKLLRVFFSGNVFPDSLISNLFADACLKKDAVLAKTLALYVKPLSDNRGNTPLHKAALKGMDEVVSVLIESGHPVDATNDYEHSPLHFACEKGQLKVVQALLKGGANAAIQDKNGVTPLHSASIMGHAAIIELLHESGGKVNAKDDYELTPLSYAINSGKADAVLALIKCGAGVNDRDFTGQTPLHKACEMGQADIVTLLLEHGAEANPINGNFDTPLHLLAKAGLSNPAVASIVQALIQKGANLNAKNKEGQTPLHLAHSNPSMISQLIAAGADKNPIDNEGNTPLHLAADNLSREGVVALIRNGADIDARNIEGQTPLHFAYSNSQIISQLIAAGADKNPIDNEGNTPLHLAVENNSKEGVQALIRNRADTEVRNRDGETPFFIASKDKDNTAIFKILLPLVDDVNAKNKLGMTPFHAAALAGHLEAVKALADPSNIEETDSARCTALHHAAAGGSHEVITYLVDVLKANLNALSVHGETPFDLAIKNDIAPISKFFLQDKGAKRGVG